MKEFTITQQLLAKVCRSQEAETGRGRRGGKEGGREKREREQADTYVGSREKERDEMVIS